MSSPAIRSANQCQFSVSDVTTIVTDSSPTAHHMHPPGSPGSPR